MRQTAAGGEIGASSREGEGASVRLRCHRSRLEGNHGEDGRSGQPGEEERPSEREDQGVGGRWIRRAGQAGDLHYGRESGRFARHGGPPVQYRRKARGAEAGPSSRHQEGEHRGGPGGERLAAENGAGPTESRGRPQPPTTLVEPGSWSSSRSPHPARQATAS